MGPVPVPVPPSHTASQGSWWDRSSDSSNGKDRIAAQVRSCDVCSKSGFSNGAGGLVPLSLTAPPFSLLVMRLRTWSPYVEVGAGQCLSRGE